MARLFVSGDAGFDTAFSDFLKEPRGDAQDTRDIVFDILADVEARGGAAVADYTKRFDRFEIDPVTLKTRICHWKLWQRRARKR